MELSEIEIDLIDFISKKRNRNYKEIEAIFVSTKKRFKFYNAEYRDLCDDYHHLHKILYDDVDEHELVDSYKFYGLLHLFRFVSYSYTDQKPTFSIYLRTLFRIFYTGDFGRLFSFIKRKIFKEKTNDDTAAHNLDYAYIAKTLVNALGDKVPVVVDYGCGIGHHSYEISKLNPHAKIYLVDIDCLYLEFAAFRFKKHGINVEVIPVTKENLYPSLPQHNICIATEVMEHVMRPLEVYKNIAVSLEKDGVLYGSFEDHTKEMFHVSTELSELRKARDVDFRELSHLCYKKVT